MASIRTRKNAEGTVRYVVRWREGGGSGVETSEVLDTRHQAELLRDYLNANGQTYTLATEAFTRSRAHGPSMADIAEQHISGLSGVAARTKADYRRDVRLHIIPALGSIRASQLTRRDVRRWVNQMHDDGASPKSIANRHGLLSAIMGTAVEDGVRSDNPCRGVRLPERQRTSDREAFLEVEEYNTLLHEVPDHWKPTVELLAGTGMRWGEAVALTVGDFVSHGNPPFLMVTKALKRDDNNGHYIANPKTRRGTRDVTVSSELAGILDRLSDARGPDEKLLLSPTGKMISYQYFQREVWTPAVRRAMKTRAGHPLRTKAKIHHLRHSHGGWLIAEGVDIMAVSRRLGHESIQTTIGIYGHVSIRSERAAADALSRLFRPGPIAGDHTDVRP